MAMLCSPSGPLGRRLVSHAFDRAYITRLMVPALPGASEPQHVVVGAPQHREMGGYYTTVIPPVSTVTAGSRARPLPAGAQRGTRRVGAARPLGRGGLLELDRPRARSRRRPRSPCRPRRSAGTRPGRAPAGARARPGRPSLGTSGPRPGAAPRSRARSRRPRRRRSAGPPTARAMPPRSLAAVERLRDPGALHHQRAAALEPLVGGEAPAAARHSRRRRIAAPSSAGRESTTLSSSSRQYGQRTPPRYRARRRRSQPRRPPPYRPRLDRASAEPIGSSPRQRRLDRCVTSSTA